MNISTLKTVGAVHTHTHTLVILIDKIRVAYATLLGMRIGFYLIFHVGNIK